MEEIADDHRERQTPPLVLARDLEELVLVPVAQLGLPEAGGPFRQHRRKARGAYEVAHDVGRRRPRRDPVVNLPRCVGDPPRAVGAQLDPANARHVPEEPVTPAGESERHRDLGVALEEVHDGTLLVQQAVLVLSQPVEALYRVGVERQLTAEEVPAAPAVTALGRRGEIGNALAKQLSAVRPEETHEGRERHKPLLAIVVHLDDEVAVAHPRPVVEDLDLGLGGSFSDQGTAGRFRDRAPERRAQPNAAVPPCVDLENLAALEHRESGFATYESCQSPNLFTSGSDPSLDLRCAIQRAPGPDERALRAFRTLLAETIG